MTREEFCILNNLYDALAGRAQCKADLFLTRALQAKKTYSRLVREGLIDDRSGLISSKGLEALKPYRVDSAVILAAGSATRFIPLSLEQPKGLYEVRGEKLIERQIQQLKEAGIRDITVVLGYKKDMFSYLEEKHGVRLLFNPAYNVKNNIETLLTAKNFIKNSYICVCDSYYVENPFHQYEYRPFYAGFSAVEAENEIYAHVDAEGRIIRMEESESGGLILLGHAFWTEAFTKKFMELAEADRETGNYDSRFWEWLVRDNLDVLPAIYF